MFSKRLHCNASENAFSRLLTDKRARGETLFDLTQSNPTQVGLRYPADKILAALARPEAMVYTPDPRGLIAARQAICHYYQDQGCGLRPADLLLTASTSEAYAVLFKLLGDARDEVLVPIPGYPLLGYLAAFEGLRAIAYPTRPDDSGQWRIDLDFLSALITSRTRAVVLVNPNNPTGAYVDPETLAGLDRICRRRNLAMIVDEVFSDFPAADFPRPGIRTALFGRTALTFVLNGFSKMLALPQVKLAWIAVAGDPGLADEARQRLALLLDFYLSAGTPVQHAVAELFSLRRMLQEQVRARLEHNSHVLVSMARQTDNCRVLPRQGGWYAVAEIFDTVGDEKRVLELLARCNTVVHPGLFYDFNREGFVVLSLLPHPEVFREGADRMMTLFGRVTGG